MDPHAHIYIYVYVCICIYIHQYIYMINEIMSDYPLCNNEPCLSVNIASNKANEVNLIIQMVALLRH